MAPRLVRRVEPALVRRRSLAEKSVEETDELDEASGALPRRPLRLAQDRRVPARTAGADPQREAAAGDVVEGEELSRERDRMAEVEIARAIGQRCSGRITTPRRSIDRRDQPETCEEESRLAVAGRPAPRSQVKNIAPKTRSGLPASGARKGRSPTAENHTSIATKAIFPAAAIAMKIGRRGRRTRSTGSRCRRAARRGRPSTDREDGQRATAGRRDRGGRRPTGDIPEPRGGSSRRSRTGRSSSRSVESCRPSASAGRIVQGPREPDVAGCAGSA